MADFFNFSEYSILANCLAHARMRDDKVYRERYVEAIKSKSVQWLASVE